VQVKKNGILVSRRGFLQNATAVAAATGLGPRLMAGGAVQSGRPNILFIMTDQQHAGMMSCTGNPWLKTPNMDALAAGGTRFERAYCTNPVCVPSRFSLFTGCLPSVIEMESNEQFGNEVPEAILRNGLGRVFRDAGYRTGYCGKRHLTGAGGKNNKVEPYGFEPIDGDDPGGREPAAASCARFLKEKHDRPFLLVASLINPHDICYMALRAWQRTVGSPAYKEHKALAALDEALELPAGMSDEEFFTTCCPPLPGNHAATAGEPEGLTTSDWRPFRAYVRKHWTERDWRLHRYAYARLTERVDAQVGTILQALRESGLEQNTLVVFTSDHGDLDAAHKMEHKSMPYEEAMRVPLILNWPGVVRAGAVDREHLVSNGLDLIPSMCDYAGIAPPTGLPGRSVRPLADGGAPGAWRARLVIENDRTRTLHAGTHKYTVYDSGVNRELLVDLAADPGELRNLASDPEYRELLAAGRRELREWYAAHGLELPQRYRVAD
jgi:arylsulfatase A-like enzyme